MKINDKIKKRFSRVLNLLFPFLLILFIDSFYNYYNFGIFFEMSTTGALIISTIIIYLIFLILVFLTQSIKKSNIILLTFGFLILLINEIKIFYMDMPIYISDIYYLFNINEILGFTNSTLLSLLKKELFFFIIQFVSFLVMFFLIKKSPNIQLSNVKVHFASIPILILIIFFIPIPLTNNIVLTGLLQSEKIKDYNYCTDDRGYYLMYGVISGMYAQMLEERVFEPETYNSEIVDKTMNELKINYFELQDIKPNIILVFSESFWDVDKLEEVKFDKEITPNFKLLSEKGKLLEMISPTYGGRSSNVEFELLTGANTAFYNNAYIPYMRMYNNDSFYNKSSIIKELKNNDYITKILSTSSDKLYNCGKVYDYFGVDDVEFLDKVSLENIKGYYPSDDFVANKIISNFNNKTNKPEFYMALTMQAHMPYLKYKYNKYDINIIESDLTKEENEVLLSYAQGIYDADKQLGKLYEFISNYEEPTMLIFLGDHLPYLKTTENENLIDKLKYFNTNDDKLNIYRKYNTQALVVSNYDIEYDDTKYLGPDILLAYLLQQNKINVSKYYQYLLKTKNILPTFNRHVAIDNDANIYYTEQISNNLLETYNMRNNIQYNFFNGE